MIDGNVAMSSTKIKAEVPKMTTSSSFYNKWTVKVQFKLKISVIIHTLRMEKNLFKRFRLMICESQAGAT